MSVNQTMMKSETEEQIASFTVENNNQELKQVVISQDIHSHYTRDKNYPKRYRLESLYGEAVYRTEDPDILKLSDGSLLKRKRQ